MTDIWLCHICGNTYRSMSSEEHAVLRCADEYEAWNAIQLRIMQRDPRYASALEEVGPAQFRMRPTGPGTRYVDLVSCTCAMGNDNPTTLWELCPIHNGD